MFGEMGRIGTCTYSVFHLLPCNVSSTFLHLVIVIHQNSGKQSCQDLNKRSISQWNCHIFSAYSQPLTHKWTVCVCFRPVWVLWQKQRQWPHHSWWHRGAKDGHFCQWLQPFMEVHEHCSNSLSFMPVKVSPLKSWHSSFSVKFFAVTAQWWYASVVITWKNPGGRINHVWLWK